MVRYVGSVIVPYSRERVFKLMGDWTNLKIWDINITKSQLSDDQPTGKTVGEGVRYDCAFKAGSAEIDVAYECVKYSVGNPSEAHFLGLATLFKSRDSVRCDDAENDQTKVTAEFNLTFRGILSPFSFILGREMEKTGPIVMKDIEKFIHEELGAGGATKTTNEQKE